ncbi:MAG: class I mannose-6-phosphate isomerase [Kiritimatiellae bacterium]|nr:class I mannose-6-phosphate isomerase [Kiritimatiellia bacterium]
MIGIPLSLSHIYSSAPWGGGWLKELFGRSDAPEVCSESWEVSADSYGMSRVVGGPFDGRTLPSLAEEFGAALTGTKAPDPHRFPLLIKLLDARRSLSVQVHPNERNAALTGGDAKSEAWIVLEASPGAALYAGVAKGTTRESFAKAVAHGEALVGTLKRHAVDAGDVLYVPGGVVHAIGAGCLVYEVQQNSRTTYRLYDWDRVDENGNARPLHIEQAFKSIDFDFPPVRVHHSGKSATLLRTRYFTVREYELSGDMELESDGSSFAAVFAKNGGVKLSAGGYSASVMRGSSALLPADAARCLVRPKTTSTKIIVTTL